MVYVFNVLRLKHAICKFSQPRRSLVENLDGLCRFRLSTTCSAHRARRLWACVAAARRGALSGLPVRQTSPRAPSQAERRRRRRRRPSCRPPSRAAAQEGSARQPHRAARRARAGARPRLRAKNRRARHLPQRLRKAPPSRAAATQRLLRRSRPRLLQDERLDDFSALLEPSRTRAAGEAEAAED